MIVGLDYSCRDFYLLEVNSIRLSESEGNSDYFSKMLVTSASMALEHFYLSIKDSSHKVGTSEIYCFSKEELEEIKQCIETSVDVISYNLTSITSVFLYGTDDYIHLYNKINVGIDDPNFYIINNFLKIHATPKSVNQKVENVGLDFLFPVEEEIYKNPNYIPNIICLNSNELLIGTFKHRIYYYTIKFKEKLVWDGVSELVYSAIKNTSYYLGFDYDSNYEDICEETEYGEVGVCVTLPTNISIIEAAFSFLNVGCFKYQIKDITDNILFHSDVPTIYLNKFNSDEGFYNAVNGVIEELVDIDSIIQKMTNEGKLYLLPCESKLLDSIK